MKRFGFLVFALLAAVSVFGQGQNGNGNPQNCDNGNKSKQCVATFNGRWEFAILTGDSPLQLSDYGQSGIDTYLIQNGATVSNIGSQTYDYTGADQYGVGLDATGTVSGNQIVLTFTKPANAEGNVGQPGWSETFTGTLNVGQNADHSALYTITGTYTNTMPSAWSNGSGTFTATWFPNFQNSTYVGVLDSLNMDGTIGTQTYPASFTLSTDPTTYDLTGTVNVASLVNPTTGVACFANQPLTIFNGWVLDYAPVWGQSIAVGEAFTLAAKDNLGNYVFIEAYGVTSQMQPAGVGESWLYPSYPLPNNGPYGTNQNYAIVFSIYGGPCDRWEGADKPFTLVHGSSQNNNSNGNSGLRRHGHQ